MKCSHCGAEVPADRRYCPGCGADLGIPIDTAQQRRAAKLASGTGFALGQAARRARLEASYAAEELIGARAYNAILLGVLLWGLLVNALLCVYAGAVLRYIPPLALLIGYAVCAFVGVRIAARSRQPLVSFLGYNLVVVPFGLVIAVMVESYGGIGSAVVRDAFVYTLLITGGMGAVVLIAPGLFEKLGGALLGCLGGLVLCEIVLLLFGVRQNVTDWAAAGLFSLYIGYDIHRSQQFAKTVDNAVDSALDIYLDVANLFIRLMEILGKRKD
ncbi:MAG: Bax inhibitor-1 family protein [Eubacteriales bacterium]|nr:Bax inhibitor-1 family protein [Eubacteriales bacterium]